MHSCKTHRNAVVRPGGCRSLPPVLQNFQEGLGNLLGRTHRDAVRDQAVVKVLAAQVGVARGRLDLEDAPPQLSAADHIEGPPAQVVMISTVLLLGACNDCARSAHSNYTCQ